MYRFLSVIFLLTAHQAHAIDVIAHRGYACLEVENSVQSVESAWLAGADGVEVDVRVSSDGIAYLFHDEEISKTKIADLPFSSVNALNAAPIPTLYELLSKVRPVGYYVFDLKTSDLEDLNEVLSVIKDSGLGMESVTFQSGKLEVLDHIRRHLPGSRLTYLTNLKWKIPYLLRPDVDQLVTMLGDSKIDRVSVKGRSFVNRRFVDAIRATGREVHVWTINDPSRAMYYRSLGVDGLITDRVEGLFGEAGGKRHREKPCRTTAESG